jgi:hypothetical protein
MSTKKPTSKQTKPTKGEKTMAKALRELQQESASLQVLGRALTPQEQAKSKALKRIIKVLSSL